MSKAAIRHRILVVDDDPENLRYITTLLKSKGDLLHVATDGTMALRIAREVSPDLILLDIHMPGSMDGIETCRQIKADDTTKAIPVLFLTGRDDRDTMIRAFDAGGADYVLKPFDSRVLKARIRTQIELSILTRDLEATLSERTDQLEQANQRLRRLAAQLALVEERERRRLATELHDSPMQKLALAQMQLVSALRSQRGSNGRSPDCPPIDGFDTALYLLRETANELRGLQFQLSPPLLHREGLTPALHWLASHATERFGVVVGCDADESLPPIRGDIAVALFQCARELVHNLAKHASASQGMISLTVEDGELLLLVVDNGIGLEESRQRQPGAPLSAELETGFGLFSIRERLALLGGSLELASGPDGTRARVRIPFNSEQSGNNLLDIADEG